MRVITKQTLLATVAERFREAHQRRDEWIPTPEGGDASAHLRQTDGASRRTKRRGSTCRSSVIIAGQKIVCDECGEDRAVTVLLGEEIHHPTDMICNLLRLLKTGQAPCRRLDRIAQINIPSLKAAQISPARFRRKVFSKARLRRYERFFFLVLCFSFSKAVRSRISVLGSKWFASSPHL